MNGNAIGVLIGSSVVSAAVSGAATFWITKKVLAQKYADIASVEIEEAKRYYSRLQKTEEFSDPTEVLERLHGEEVVEKLNYGTALVERTELPSTPYSRMVELERRGEPHSPKDEEDDAEDDGAEGEFVIEGEPYIISYDTFMRGDKDYSQKSLTYFENDGVMIDEHDMPIDEIDVIIGNRNIRFGHLSKDAMIVFVRNDKLETDFEITRNKGSFARDILGFIEHEDKPLRKFRRDYE